MKFEFEMKRYVKQILFACLYGFYKISFWRPPIVVVLMYHSVSNWNWEFAVRPEVFEDQINHLYDQGFSFISSKDLGAWLAKVKELPPKSILVTFDDGYKDFVDNAWPILKKCDAQATLFIHANRSSDPLGNQIPLLDWEDLKKLSQAGVELGDHSYSHPNLKQMNRTEVENQIETSQAVFKEQVGFKPSIMAYPEGKFNQVLIECLKSYGYHLGFSIDRGLVYRNDDPFRLRRSGVTNKTTWLEFKARVTPMSDWYEYLIQSK